MIAKAFLEKIADYLIETYPQDLGNIAVVLPSQRGGVFLKKYLARKLDHIALAPKIISIADFAKEITGLKPADPLSLPFELYQVHCEVAGDDKQTLDSFLSWCDLLIKDFSELDQYLVDVTKVFNHLSESYALNEWNIDGSPLSEFQLNYINFYQSLGIYYKVFRDRLLAKNQAWSGLLYRKLAEQIEEHADQIKWKKVIFGGFNALSNAETTFIRNLISLDKAEIFWDGDEYYFYKNGKGNTDIEAGHFLQRYAKNWKLPEINWIGDYFKNSTKNIQIIGVPRNVGQVKYAAEIIQKLDDSPEEQTQTALVLAKENLLIPAINSMPENIQEYNITMGLPLDQLPIYDLFQELFKFHVNRLKFSKEKGNNKQFYAKDFIRILKHPSILTVLKSSEEGNKECSPSLLSHIQKADELFLGKAFIEEWISKQVESSFLEFIQIITKDWTSDNFLFFDDLKRISKLLLGPLKESKNQSIPPQEYLYLFFQIFGRIQEALNEYKSILSLQAISKIFGNLCKNQTLSFYGEPLQGIQLMGVLETRTLDFKNIIMLSVNEGILPTGKSQNSFIPDEIKLRFGLPTYKEKNAVYAYHFYRLMQRAENVYLIYNTETEVLGGGHKSRFINQLQLELSEYNPKIKIEEKVLGIPLNAEHSSFQKDNTIQIAKDLNIQDRIKNKVKKGLSPSSINRYINCPLQFYFTDILQLEEEEILNETIDAATLGTMVHEVLESFYKPLKNEILSPALLKTFIPQIKTKANTKLQKTYKKENLQFGKNRLILEVGMKFVENFLNYEVNHLYSLKKKNQEIVIFDLECFLQTEIKDTCSGIKVKIKGFVDRVDIIDDQVRIIDYKTGRVEKKELLFSDFQEIFETPKLSKCLQLLTYAWLWFKSYPEEKRVVSSGIFSFRNLKEGFLEAGIQVDKRKFNHIFTKESLDEFEIHLSKLIGELLDPSIIFDQTPDEANCQYCAFKEICRR